MAQEPITCLNCETVFSGKFCPNCAQRASTDRLNFRRVFSAEYLSDYLNLDRGILHTMWDLAHRPGHMINDYLAGKRRRYFNFVGFLLIMLAVEAVLYSVATNTPSQMLYETFASQLEQQFPTARDWLSLEDIEKMLASQKFIFLVIVPLAAYINRLVFRRMKYNLMEHSVAITFMLAMNTMFGFALLLFGMIPVPFETYSSVYGVFTVFVMIMGFVLFWQFSAPGNYTVGGRIWRVLLAYLSVTFVLGLSLQLVIGIYSGYRHAKAGDADEIKKELFE
ncbi:DUF3667 domain-containing protein [Lewinella sp. W8]|uniref:DUF3667 domain-containing protein n=1 Tax=Lewinella sp. W8 TaxID=2528208 RepID=UPI001067DDE4|nr:DUF3667 domain-containing protein [Lewinella sp. W8]MTB51415.1 DUF3667 domain-containing protein [Lewinella sp. W8]